MQFQQVCYRGEVHRNTFASAAADPGDLGVGKYWTTCKFLASHYGEVREQMIVLENPLRVDAAVAMALVEIYSTVDGLLEDRVQASIQMTKDLQAAGYDGIITDGYETREGELAINVFPAEIDENHFCNTQRYKLYQDHMEKKGK